MYHNYYKVCKAKIAKCGKDVAVLYSKDGLFHRIRHPDPPSCVSDANWQVYPLTRGYQRGSKIHCAALCWRQKVLPMEIATYALSPVEGGGASHLP